MSQRCKTWMWIALALYTILAAVNLVRGITADSLTPVLFASLAIQAGIVAGISLMLFFSRKSGFFLICTIQACAYFVNVFLMGQNVFQCMLYFVALPFITWYFLKTDASWQALS